MSWTPEEIERLKQLTLEHSVPEIADLLGKSCEQILYKIRKLGLKTRAKGARTPEQIEEILAYGEQHGAKEAAAKFGMTKGSFSALKRRVSLESRLEGREGLLTGEWTPEELSRLGHVSVAWSRERIAIEFNRSLSQVKYQLQKLGLRTPGSLMTRFSPKQEKRILKFIDENGMEAGKTKYGVDSELIRRMRKRHEKKREEILQRKDPEELLKLRQQAVRLACKKQRVQDAEDFGSYVVICALQRNFVNLVWAWSEYRRENDGSPRTKVGRAKRNGQMFYKEIQDEPDLDDPHHGVQIGKRDPDNLAILQALIGIDLLDRERMALVLSFHFGLKMHEIAMVFGVTPARAHQIFKSAVEKMQKHDRKENLDPLYRSEPVGLDSR